MTTPEARATRVFISYSHDSPEHADRVLALADHLRSGGIDAVIDQYQAVPPEGWQLWMEKQIRDADFVLLVCTETYLRRVMKEEAQGKGLGVLWESAIIYSYLYEAGLSNTKFIPVVFGGGDTQFIPQPLKPTTYYDVDADAGYERLYQRLTDQHATPAGPLGLRRAMPPRERPVRYGTDSQTGAPAASQSRAHAPDDGAGQGVSSVFYQPGMNVQGGVKQAGRDFSENVTNNFYGGGEQARPKEGGGRKPPEDE